MPKKITLSSIDAKLESVIDSSLTELKDDELGNHIISINKKYTKGVVGNFLSLFVTIKLNDCSIKNENYFFDDFSKMVDRSETFSIMLKHCRKACRKIEAEGHKCMVYVSDKEIILKFDSLVAIEAKPVVVEPQLTFRDIELDRNSSFIHPVCIEKSILRCYGGFGRAWFEDLEDAMKGSVNVSKQNELQIGVVTKKPRVELVGWKTPMPIPNSRDFSYDCTHFMVTVRDIKTSVDYNVYGYLFEETLAEFNRRLYEYAEQATDVMLKSRGDKYNEFSVASHFLDKSPDAEKILSKYSVKDRNKVISLYKAHLEYEKRR